METKEIKNECLAEQGSIEQKKCVDCGRVLPITAFQEHARSKDGHMASCKDCRRRMAHGKATTLNPLAKFTGRQLMDELFERGYRGTLEYTEVHKIVLGRK